MIAQPEKTYFSRPRLVLAYADSLYASLGCRHFRRLGWEVHLAPGGAEARRLAQELDPAVVILDTDLADESGWLTCAKLHREQPDLKIILVRQNPTEEDHRLAAFVGAAALVCRAGGVRALIEEVVGRALPAAS